MSFINVRLILGIAVLVLSFFVGSKGLIGEFGALLYLAGILVLGVIVNKFTIRMENRISSIEKLLLESEVVKIPKINVRPPIFYYLIAVFFFLFGAVLFLLDLWIFMGLAITLSIILYFNAELENLRRADDFLFEHLEKEIKSKVNSIE